MVSSDNVQEAIAHTVREARVASGMTKVELARALALSKQGYNPYEKGRGTFTIEQIFRLSKVLGHSPQYFLSLDNGLTEEEDELVTRFRNIHVEVFREGALNMIREFEVMDQRHRDRFGKPQ